MPAPTDALATDVAEFLTLLTTGELGPEELAAGTEAVVLAVQDPDAYFDQYLDEDQDGWLRDWSTSMAEVAATNAVVQALCISDKADELYEEISEAFSEPLPEPPEEFQYLHEYMRFADEAIQQRGPQPGGYELLEFASSYGDDLQVLLVYRKDTPRVLELGQQLQVKVARLNLTGEY